MNEWLNYLLIQKIPKNSSNNNSFIQVISSGNHLIIHLDSYKIFPINVCFISLLVSWNNSCIMCKLVGVLKGDDVIITPSFFEKFWFNRTFELYVFIEKLCIVKELKMTFLIKLLLAIKRGLHMDITKLFFKLICNFQEEKSISGTRFHT